MKQRILKFSVCDQRITTEDISVVADSKNYLAALFSFDSTWDGTEKTAVFSQGEKVYNMLLEGDMCRIPAEVITEGAFYVSVFGGDLITADKIRIEVVPSGLMEGIAPPVPTEDIYNQLVERVASEAADAAASAELAVLSSQMSQDFADVAKTQAEASSSSATQAKNSEISAANSKVLAEQAAEKAETAATAAQGSAEESHRYHIESLNTYHDALKFCDSAFSAADSANMSANTAFSSQIYAEEAAARAENAANETREALKWKTLLDVTLTEEQGGVASLMLAIDDAEALANAKRLRLFAFFSVAEAYAANKFYTTMVIRDADNTRYNSTMLAGYNVAGGENVKYFVMANVDISDIGFVSGSFTRTYHSIAVFPTPWYGTPTNNNVSTKHIAGGYPAERIKKYQPYFELKVTTPDTVTFEEGTRIVLEVQE